jgi:hypothetical protein
MLVLLLLSLLLQSNLVKRERIKQDFALSGTQLLPLEPYPHTSYNDEKGFCSKRDRSAVILTSRLTRFDCTGELR